MFRVLLRTRLQMLRNSLRAASFWHKFLISGLVLFGLLIFTVIGVACAALVILMQGGHVHSNENLTPDSVSFVEHVYQYLFFFLLAGAVPFVASSLFQDNDLPLLLTTPISPSAVVAAKLLDSIFANSAQFMVLGVPVLVGLGWGIGVAGMGWAWFSIVLLLMLIFAPCFTGTLLLVLARVLGIRRVRFVVMLVSALLALSITLFAVAGASRVTGKFDPGHLHSILAGPIGQERFQGSSMHAQARALTANMRTTVPVWMPSSWASNVAVDTAGGHGITDTGRNNLAILWSVTLLLVGFCILLGRKIVTSEAILEQQDLNSVGKSSRARSGIPFPGLSIGVTGLLVKDLRYVGRDTILIGQIGTTLILFFVPFVLKGTQNDSTTFPHDMYGTLAVTMISLIVFMVTSIIGLSSVGLEGRGAWMILASPLTRRAFLQSKWLVSFIISAGLVAALTVIASIAFGWSFVNTGFTLAVFACGCFALSGLGVGLSGLFPRFLYDNPAHRASVWAMILGFVFATLYIIMCGFIAAVSYALILHRMTDTLSTIIVAAIVFVLLSIGSGIFPIAMAEKRLAGYEWEL